MNNAFYDNMINTSLDEKSKDRLILQLKSKYESLQDKYTKSVAANNALRNENQRLSSSNALLKKSSLFNNKKMDDLKIIIDNNNITIRDLRSEISLLQSVIDNCKLEMAEIQNQNSKLLVENLNFKNKMKEIDASVKIKNDCIIRIKKELAESKSDIQELTTRCNELYNIKKSLEIKLKKNSQNSSIPTSMELPVNKRPNEYNSRVKSNLKPGAQPGHPHHARKNITPNTKVELKPDIAIISQLGWYKTKKVLSKKIVNLKINTFVTEYVSPVYRNKITGAFYHPEFPGNLKDDITYGHDVEAFLLWLTSRCNVSINKAQEFIYEITNKTLKPSTGYINRLISKFGKLTDDKIKQIFENIHNSHVIYTDTTCCNINGIQHYINVFTDGSNVMYKAADSKTIESLHNTPIADYDGILVHDHDTKYYHFGSYHQECIAHIKRYIRAAIDEKDNRQWLLDLDKFFNNLILKYKENPSEISYEQSLDDLDDILSDGFDEYKETPPDSYIMEGYRLLKRLMKYKEQNLLFLKYNNVSYTNNISERLLRSLKRKVKQAVSFRSKNTVDYLCSFLSIIESSKKSNENSYEMILRVLNSPTREQ